MLMEPTEIYDRAIVGVMEMHGAPQAMILYDKSKIITMMVEDMGMESEEDAMEFFEYNTIGSWVGEQTPAFLDLADAKTIEENDLIDTEEFSGIKPGLEHAVLGIYERFGGVMGIIYDKHMLTPEQRKDVSVVDTTETALLEFKGLPTTTSKTTSPKQI